MATDTEKIDWEGVAKLNALKANINANPLEVTIHPEDFDRVIVGMSLQIIAMDRTNPKKVMLTLNAPTI